MEPAKPFDDLSFFPTQKAFHVFGVFDRAFEFPKLITVCIENPIFKSAVMFHAKPERGVGVFAVLDFANRGGTRPRHGF
jgi:hypothetical protein